MPRFPCLHTSRPAYSWRWEGEGGRERQRGGGGGGGGEERPPRARPASPTQAASSCTQPAAHWLQSLLVGPVHSLHDSSQARRRGRDTREHA